VHVVGDVLRLRRDERQLSRVELAELVGLTTKTIQRAEGGGPVRSQVVRELCRVLALPLSAVLRPSESEFVGRLRAFGRGPSSAPAEWVARDAEVATLRVYLDPPDHADRVRLCALAGPPNIGKTALAQYVVAQLADAFPAGVVWLDGSHITTTADLHAAQRDIAAALGFGMPASPGARRDSDQAFCHHFWDRRRLLVIDDVRSPALIETLLGDNALGVMLVTTASRRVAEHVGRAVLELGPIEAAHVRAVLERYVGASRLAADVAGTDALIELIARAPGSIHPTGRLLQREPFTRPSDLAHRLTDRADTSGWWEALLLDRYQREQVRVSDGAWRVLATLATRDASLFSVASVSELCELPRATASGYLSELLDAFLVHLEPDDTLVSLDAHAALSARAVRS